MSAETQSSGLFSIFVISIFSLLLIPITIYKFCCTEGTSAAQPWQKGKKKSKLAAAFNKYATKGNLILLALWGVWFVLLLWVQVSVHDMKPFDPFEILGLPSSATDQQIKKAWRELSLKFHPDKNPDPAAQKFFTEHISKAYAALTDEVSKQNYEKYGHPDGPQAVNVGVALPSFMFANDKNTAPIMLLALVGCGILLPLVVVSWYMLSANRFHGPNNVMAETLAIFLHSKYNVKESQSLVRIPETLVCAVEFITLPTPAEHTAPMDELRKLVLRYHPDLKDKAAFWKRKASVLKVHLLLLAYLEREQNIPAILKPDLSFVLQKAPPLLEEMFKIACYPRPPQGYGWLTPAVAVVEMQQCLAQAMSTAERKPQGKQADASTVLLQLPHFDADVVKKLKRRKINTIKELQDLSESERTEALLSAGLDAAGADEATSLLMTLPTVHARVTFEMEGETDIMEQDVAKCKVRLVVTRASHALPSFEPPSKGKSVRAYAPQYSHPHDENWYVLLADTATNSLISHSKVSLAEAEAFGFRRPELVDEWAALAAPADAGAVKKVGRAADTASKFIRSYKQRPGGSTNALDAVAAEGMDVPAEEAGQLVEIPFLAPMKANKYDWQVIIMCDAYIGCDRTVPARLRVSPMTKAAQESREARALSKQKLAPDSDEESQADGKGKDDNGDGSGGSDSEEDESDYEYDSDETGELESGSDEDEPAEPVKTGNKKPTSLLDVMEGVSKQE